MNKPYEPEAAETVQTTNVPARLVRRVLLLFSYCGDDNPECSDDFPCPECLQMNNVAEVDADAIQFERVIGGLEYLKDIRDYKYPPNVRGHAPAPNRRGGMDGKGGDK